jgi:hypothetical protein
MTKIERLIKLKSKIENCQTVVKIVVKKLSKSCQKVVKQLSKFVKYLSKLVIIVFQ